VEDLGQDVVVLLKPNKKKKGAARRESLKLSKDTVEIH